jgi:hypothetical protein
VGQQIVIASSDENPLNSEVATITAVSADKKTLNISIALQYRHWGQVKIEEKSKEKKELIKRPYIPIPRKYRHWGKAKKKEKTMEKRRAVSADKKTISISIALKYHWG